jgi:transposase
MTTTPSGSLGQQVRVARARTVTPTAAIIDSQSLKTSCNVAEISQGIDASKKIKARKRHIATRRAGPAAGHDRHRGVRAGFAGGHHVLDQLADRHPSISKVWVDGGNNNTVICHGARQNVSVEVVKRCTSTGFHVLPRRWVVERTLGWLMQHRRLVRDYETLPPTLPGDDPLGEPLQNDLTDRALVTQCQAPLPPTPASRGSSCPRSWDSGMTCWQRLREWTDAGMWQRLHELLLARLKGDQTGPSPVDRARTGSKHHLITDGTGTPRRPPR